MTIRIFSVLALLFLTVRCFAYSDSDVWTAAIKIIYQKEAVSNYYPNEKLPASPTENNLNGLKKTIDTSDFFIYIEKNVMDISSSVIQYRLANLLKLKESSIKQYVIKGTNKKLELNSSEIAFCYKLFDKIDNEISIQRSDSCSGKELKVKTLTLSKVMYNKNKTEAILFATLSDNENRAYNYIWGIALRKSKIGWEVHGISRENYR